MHNFWKQEYIRKITKSLLKALYATVGIFLAFFVIFRIGTAFYNSYISEKQLSSLITALHTDQAHLKKQGDSISKNQSLIDALLLKDRNTILDIIKSEIANKSVGTIGVVDANGLVIGRTSNYGKYGDNVFLTTPFGRRISEGKDVQSIEAMVSGNQLYMTTGRPILQDNKFIGAVFTNYMLDMAYAQHLKQKYLQAGSEIAFYTKAGGVYGDSFADKNISQLINSYFNTGSDWIKNGLSNQTISLGDDTSYLIINYVFPGLEQKPGGILIFTPRKDISPIANTTTAFFTLLVFLLLVYKLHIQTRSNERRKYYYTMIVISSALVFILTFLVLRLNNFGQLSLKRIPYPLYNSTIRFEPEFGIYNIGSEQNISIVVDTGDEAVNVVHTKLLFDPEALEVKSISTGTSSCSYVVENKINQKEGNAEFTCGIIDANDGRNSIKVANVTIVPKHAGSAKLAFDPNETKVLASDGLGTDVLRASQDSTYRFDSFNSILDDNTSTSTTGRTFVVFSTTHPNESRWYNSSKAHFVWRGYYNEAYKYEFNTVPDTVPSNKNIARNNSVDIPVPGDGVYYFHLQALSGGPVVHYKINSDMSPPTILSMNLSSNRIVEGDVVRFSFNAEDMVSGIQKNYYVDLGNHLFLPIGEELFVPFLDAGDQKVSLRVYDNAGNYTEKTQIVHVEGK